MLDLSLNNKLAFDKGHTYSYNCQTPKAIRDAIENNQESEEEEESKTPHNNDEYVVKQLPKQYRRGLSGQMSLNHLSSIQEAPSIDEQSNFSKLMQFKSKSRLSQYRGDAIMKGPRKC